MKFHCTKTNTFCLAAVHVKINCLHFLSQWSRKEHVRKNLKQDDKRAAVELWRAKVPLSTVRNQLKVFERTKRRVLASKGQQLQPDQVKEAYFWQSCPGSPVLPVTSCLSYSGCPLSYQPTIDTSDTIYSSFHWICVWPTKTFGGDCNREVGRRTVLVYHRTQT
jgi:hypothetical protein